MSVFTVVIIIWVIYQLVISLMKKGKQQTSGKFSDTLKLPNGRSIREVLQEKPPQGSWREQMQQALQNGSRQVEEWTVHANPLKSADPKVIMQDYIQTERTQGDEVIQENGVTQGVKGTSAFEGMPSGTQPMSGSSPSFTKKELVQGVVWAEILGKPRALHPFRGPRS